MRITALATTALATLLLTAPVSFADDPIAERESRMGSIGDTNRVLNMMYKGRTDFDVDEFETGVFTISMALEGLLDYFPEGSHKNTGAKQAIWQNWEDFTSKYQHAVDTLNELSDAVDGGDEDAIMSAYKAFSNTCKDCHRQYKTRKK